MRFSNPREAIHEAYMSIRGKEPGGSGTAGVDSNARAFNQVKAGLVINAVETQPDQYRIVLQYCFAPEGVCSATDANLLFIHLFRDVMLKTKARKKLSERKIAEMSVMGVKVLRNFQNSVLNGRNQFTRQEIASALGKTNFTESLVNQWNLFEGMLYQYLERGIAPIEMLCTQQCEMIKDHRLMAIKRRIEDLNVGEQASVQYVNRVCRTNHETLNTFSHYDADVLENQLDAVKEAKHIKVVGKVEEPA